MHFTHKLSMIFQTPNCDMIKWVVSYLPFEFGVSSLILNSGFQLGEVFYQCITMIAYKKFTRADDWGN